MKPKYGIRVSGEIYPPNIERIIEREEKLIEFVIDRHPEDFSLEVFKKEYDYYSRDLLDEMEPGFMNYARTFFDDEGMPYLGDALATSQSEVSLFDVTLDLKRALKPDLYQHLIDQSFLYTPYFALHYFIEVPLRWPLRILTVMEWENPKTKEGFREYLQKYYPHQDAGKVTAEVEKMAVTFEKGG
jgi:hypothetical protein